MLGPHFIPQSVIYTQSVMLSPRFIPESVFYTQSVGRSPCFLLTASRDKVCEPGHSAQDGGKNIHTELNEQNWPDNFTKGKKCLEN